MSAAIPKQSLSRFLVVALFGSGFMWASEAAVEALATGLAENVPDRLTLDP
jgi:hypothetical protein